jgi:hypothetical protein
VRGQLFNTFWHGPALSPLHEACLRSFVARGHRVRLFCYQPVDVPPGVELADARRVLPEGDLFEFGGSFSAFSNVFRYALLHAEGGWWVDADVLCLQEELPDLTRAWAREDPDFVNGAILRFPASDPVLARLLDAARAVGPAVAFQGQLGPRLLTEQLPGPAPASTRDFYPIHWLEAHRLWMRDDEGFVSARGEGASFLHLWGAMLRFLGIELALAPPEGSFLRRLLPTHRLRPLDAAAEQRTLASVRRFLQNDDYRERSLRVLGYDATRVGEVAE